MKTKATFLCFFLFLLFPMWALADEVVDLKILEAQIIKGPADEWNAAKAALTTYLSGATQDENTIKTLKEKIAIAEAKLEKVVKITFGGEIGTSVKHANALLREKHVLEAFKKLVAADPADESAKTAVKDSENKLEELAKSRKSIQADLKRKADEQFQGFGFGIAIGALIDTGKRDRIESANLDPNGIVRVERDSNVRANFLLESHYFFTPDYNFPFGDLGGTYFDWVEKGNWGHGPFVAVQPGSEDLIEGVGIGWMVGFKRAPLFGGNLPEGLGDSFNLGAGVLVDPSEKVLGDGITANSALPAGETVIRFKETSQLGVLLLFSYSFH